MPRVVIPSHCVRDDCKAPLIPQSHGLRGAAVPDGHRLHGGRGLCKLDWEWASRTGTLEDYPPLGRTPEATVARWTELSVAGHDIDSAAQELGVTAKHLRRILVNEGAIPRTPTLAPTPKPAFDPCILDEGELP